MSVKFIPTPPPPQAPVQSAAEALGLARGIRVETSSRQWRCSQCYAMQPPNAKQAWIPDGVMKHDPEWSVTERCRENAYNGQFSAWCLKCAGGFTKTKVDPARVAAEPSAPQPPRKGFIARFLEKLHA